MVISFCGHRFLCVCWLAGPVLLVLWPAWNLSRVVEMVLYSLVATLGYCTTDIYDVLPYRCVLGFQTLHTSSLWITELNQTTMRGRRVRYADRLGKLTSGL